jgi:DNA-binding GntR family transcriptional regulator
VLKRTTKADHAYLLLRRAIVVGEIQAGEPLDELELTERFTIGRTPVREALKRLALEQFIVWPSRSTPYVRQMSQHDVHRLYESRLLMEKPAARLAATRITATQLDEVHRIGNELQVAAEAGDVYASIEADHALHIAITRGSDNRFLSEAVDRLNCGSLRLWYVAHEQLGLEHVAGQHQTIIDALDTRDPEAAEAAVHDHIILSLRRQIELSFGSSDTDVLQGLASHG